MKKKRGLVQEHLPEILIALVLLALLLASIYYIKGSGVNIFSKFGNLFRGN